MKGLLITALVFWFASCQKTNDMVGSLSAITISTSNPPRSQAPVGVMIEGTPENNRIVTAKALGVSYVRAEVGLENFSEPSSYIDSLVADSFKVVANFDYYGSQAKAPFPKDAASITSNIAKVIKTFRPYLVAIENEEENENYHTGPAQDYINELNTATAALHVNNIKVMNGGLTEDVLCILTYRNYLSQGLTAQANDFAKRTMPQAIINDLPNLANNPQLANRVAFTDSLLQAYKNMSFDYVNFHWYEPVLARWTNAAPNADAATQVDTRAMNEVITYLRDATGKPVISNEVGELNTSPAIVQDMMQQFRTSNLPYVLWYSGDGTVTNGMSKAVALNNSDGSLRSNGVAFKDFLQSNYSLVN